MKKSMQLQKLSGEEVCDKCNRPFNEKERFESIHYHIDQVGQFVNGNININNGSTQKKTSRLIVGIFTRLEVLMSNEEKQMTVAQFFNDSKYNDFKAELLQEITEETQKSIEKSTKLFEREPNQLKKIVECERKKTLQAEEEKKEEAKQNVDNDKITKPQQMIAPNPQYSNVPNCPAKDCMIKSSISKPQFVKKRTNQEASHSSSHNQTSNDEKVDPSEAINDQTDVYQNSGSTKIGQNVTKGSSTNQQRDNEQISAGNQIQQAQSLVNDNSKKNKNQKFNIDRVERADKNKSNRKARKFSDIVDEKLNFENNQQQEQKEEYKQSANKKIKKNNDIDMFNILK
eukprot:403353040